MKRLSRDEVRRHVATDPGRVYALVSDVTRTPQWSPEVIECRWLDGAAGAVAGARFVARNRRRWLTWSNKPVVEVAEPAVEFAISRTEHGGGTIRWAYHLTPERAGTAVALSYEVVRPVPLGLHVVLRLLFGVRDLQADLHANMAASLDRIAELTTAAPTAAPAPRGR